jgi:hypothetical protein
VSCGFVFLFWLFEFLLRHFTIILVVWILVIVVFLYILYLPLVLLRQKGGVFVIFGPELYFLQVKFFLSQNGQMGSLLVFDWLHSIDKNTMFVRLHYFAGMPFYFRVFKCYGQCLIL